MTQTDLAGKINITPQMVSKWELDKSLPDIITLRKLSEILGVTAAYFYGDEAAADEPTLKQEKKVRRKGRANLNEHKWKGNDFSNAVLTDLDFAYARFTDCVLSGCDFSGRSLSYTEFIACRLTGAIFRNAKLFRTDAIDGDFGGADFKDARLEKSDFKSCGFTGTVFSNAFLEKTDFLDCAMDKINFTGATLRSCSFKRHKFKTCDFTDTIFDKCKFKEAVFENCSMDRKTYNFLLTCKADLSGVQIKE